MGQAQAISAVRGSATTKKQWVQKTQRRGKTFGLALAVGAVALLGGCRSGEPSFYGLGIASGQPQSGLVALPQFRVIEVRTPTLPLRLDRDTVVLGSRDNRLEIAQGASWSAPPANLIGGALVSDLQQRLPGSVIYTQNAAVTTPPQAYIELSVGQFERLPDGHAIISGVLSVRKGGILPQPACSEAVSWVSPQKVADVPALVTALGDGVGVLSDKAITVLRRLGSCPVTGSAKPVSELQQALTQAVQATLVSGSSGH